MVSWESQKGKYVRDPRLGHRFGINYRGNDDDFNLETDNYGFIHNGNRERTTISKLNNSYRIFIIGGSAAMGMGASDNSKTIAAQLENELNKQGAKNYEVINAACGGYCSWHSVIKLSLELLNLKPNMIIDISGWNDMVHSSWGDKNQGNWIENHDRSIEDVALSLMSLQGKLNFRDLLLIRLRETKIFQYLKSKFLNLFNRNFTPKDIAWGHEKNKFKFRKNGVENYIRNLRTISGICESHKIKFLNIIQPSPIWIYLKNNDYINNDHKTSKDIIEYFKRDKKFEEVCSNFLIYLRELYQNSTKNSWSVFDLADSDIFEIYDWIDHVHLSDKGQYKLAKYISEMYIDFKND